MSMFGASLSLMTRMQCGRQAWECVGQCDCSPVQESADLTPAAVAVLHRLDRIEKHLSAIGPAHPPA